ncbi:MAG: hypothetical protein JWM44_3311 [Bacilli bacterium]|nr:hypothetical protein [Bacilli bacterium]
MHMPQGLHGYLRQRTCGNIKILFEGTASMGINVEIIHFLAALINCAFFAVLSRLLQWHGLCLVVDSLA